MRQYLEHSTRIDVEMLKKVSRLPFNLVFSTDSYYQYSPVTSLSFRELSTLMSTRYLAYKDKKNTPSIAPASALVATEAKKWVVSLLRPQPTRTSRDQTRNKTGTKPNVVAFENVEEQPLSNSEDEDPIISAVADTVLFAHLSTSDSDSELEEKEHTTSISVRSRSSRASSSSSASGAVVHCFCRSNKKRKGDTWVECEKCGFWVHSNCLSLRADIADTDVSYVCPKCVYFDSTGHLLEL